MFYFFFEARTDSANAPLVMWLQGGPGCSSEFALFYENGPYTINSDMSLSETKYGWDTNHNMIFVDQPIGTGFSYSEDPADSVYDEKAVADDLLDFLLEFYEARPHLRDLPLYITGESFAGHYIPAAAYRIWRASELELTNSINLAGVALGNPLTNALLQFSSYSDFAFANGIISEDLKDSINWWYPLCSSSLYVCDATGMSFLCSLANTVCQMVSFQPVLAVNPDINVYDISKTCDVPGCYDTSRAEQLLNDPKVRKQLGVGDREWIGCNPDIYNNLAGDIVRPYDTYLVPLLEDGVRVMVYAGERDLICNWMGNEKWLDHLEWEGREAWSGAGSSDWSAGGGTASGSIRSASGLTFVRVKDAGHMSPMDQPAVAHYMISAFTHGKNLTAISQPAHGSSTEHQRQGDMLLPGMTWRNRGEASAASKLVLGSKGSRKAMEQRRAENH